MWWWLLLVLWLALLVTWIYSLVDIIRSDRYDWDDVTPGRTGWLLTVLLLGWVTSIGYLLIARPVVRRNAERSRSEGLGV